MKIKRFFKIVLRAVRMVAFILIAVIFLGNLYLFAAKNILKKEAPTFLRYSASVVLTGSMSGAIEPNDLIITKKQADYNTGDIITFYAEGSTVTHRIVKTSADGYYTKGDANNTADRLPTNKAQVVGKVVLVIPKIGAALAFLRTPGGILCFFGIAALILEWPNIVNGLKKRKQGTN